MSGFHGDRKDNQKLSDIFITSIAGVASQLKRFFPDKIVPVVQTRGTNHFRAMFTQNRKIKKPFFAYTMTTMETNTQGYNPFVLHRRGRYGPKILSDVDPESTTEIIYNFMPATVAFRVLFITDDASDTIALAQHWLLAARNHYLDFVIDAEDQATINIKVNMDQQINFPDLEFEEIGESMVMELSMSIDTYHGSTSKKLSVSSTHLNLSSVVMDESGRSLANLGGKVYQK